MRRFTLSDAIVALSQKDVGILKFAEEKGRMPNEKEFSSVSTSPFPREERPDVFPKYVPGSSCPQLGREHVYWNVGTRDICSKCGSSRRSKL